MSGTWDPKLKEELKVWIGNGLPWACCSWTGCLLINNIGFNSVISWGAGSLDRTWSPVVCWTGGCLLWIWFAWCQLFLPPHCVVVTFYLWLSCRIPGRNIIKHGCWIKWNIGINEQFNERTYWPGLKFFKIGSSLLPNFSFIQLFSAENTSSAVLGEYLPVVLAPEDSHLKLAATNNWLDHVIIHSPDQT